MSNNRKFLMWAGIILILATGIIHLIDAPDNFDEATYKGVLFVLNGIGAIIAAIGIYRWQRSWGWGLGLIVAAGAFVFYVISRTVGLPGLPPDEWLEPLGILSLIVEGLFTLMAIAVLTTRTTPELAREVGREAYRQTN
jgi:hypothetical protein